MSITMDNNFRTGWFGFIIFWFEDLCFHLWSMLSKNIICPRKDVLFCLYIFVIFAWHWLLYLCVSEKDRPEIIADSHYSYGSVGMKLSNAECLSKYCKTWFQYFECLPAKNISNGSIWDRGLIEHDTAQLSGLSILLIAHKKTQIVYEILKT